MITAQGGRQDRPAGRGRRCRAAPRVCAAARRLDGNGFFYPPTVLADVPPDAEMAHEEIFGPVAPLYRFETEDEVIARANDTEYGLAAYIYHARPRAAACASPRRSRPA